MEKIKRIALNSCAFTVLIAVLFFAFAKISGLSEVKIDFLHFFVILLFGIVVAIANTLFEIPRLHIVWKFLIHYAILFVAFYIVFLNFANIDSNKGAAVIFTALIVFTFLYVVVAFIAWLFKKAFKIAAKSSTVKESNAPKKESYTPRYK